MAKKRQPLIPCASWMNRADYGSTLSLQSGHNVLSVCGGLLVEPKDFPPSSYSYECGDNISPLHSHGLSWKWCVIPLLKEP